MLRLDTKAVPLERRGALRVDLAKLVVPGVKICKPVDFKGDKDGICVRCEGFAECSLRYVAGQPGEITFRKRDGRLPSMIFGAVLSAFFAVAVAVVPGVPCASGRGLRERAREGRGRAGGGRDQGNAREDRRRFPAHLEREGRAEGSGPGAEDRLLHEPR